MPSSSRPNISITTTAYNAGKYIGECIESGLSQREVCEHVIVDGGSTDNTAAVIKSFKTPRVRYFFQKNQGPAVARNLAITKSKGSYILILDADDLLAPLSLARKSAALASHPGVDVIFGNMATIRESGEFLDNFSGLVNVMFRGMSTKELIAHLWRHHYVPDVQPMWRAARLKELGGYRHVKGEDIELLLRALLKGISFGFVPEVTGYYRLTQGSLSRGGGYDRFFKESDNASYWKSHEESMKSLLFSEDALPSLKNNVYKKVNGNEVIIVEGGGANRAAEIGVASQTILEWCSGRRNIRSLVKKGKTEGISKEHVTTILFHLFRADLIDLRWPN